MASNWSTPMTAVPKLHTQNRAHLHHPRKLRRVPGTYCDQSGLYMQSISLQRTASGSSSRLAYSRPETEDRAAEARMFLATSAVEGSIIRSSIYIVRLRRDDLVRHELADVLDVIHDCQTPGGLNGAYRQLRLCGGTRMPLRRLRGITTWLAR
jgi:hypothetical protein